MHRPRNRKSKNGCFECKKRHIKCDEKHPVCSNCSISDRSCKYSGNAAKPRQWNFNHIPHEAQASSTTDIGHYSSQEDLQPPVNMLHMELLQFFNAVTMESLQKSHNEDLMLSLPDILQLSLSAPYLINQILAIAALHRSHVRRPQRGFYYLQATQLQTHALSIFNSVGDRDINPENCLQIFLFSAIVGVHMLCDALTHREDQDDLMAFLGRFIRCIHLHRGVRLATRPAVSVMKDSTLRQLLSKHAMMTDQNNVAKVAILGHSELAKLSHLIDGAKLGLELTNTYQEAIGYIQAVMDTAKDGAKPAPSTIIAWPALVSTEFVESLKLSRPEALVILAHYAVLLNLHADLWIFQDGGRFLIEAITRHLGPDWADWLEWPNQNLRG